jgi:hypothetical protein
MSTDTPPVPARSPDRDRRMSESAIYAKSCREEFNRLRAVHPDNSGRRTRVDAHLDAALKARIAQREAQTAADADADDGSLGDREATDLEMQIWEARDLGNVSVEPPTAVDPHLPALSLDVARRGDALRSMQCFRTDRTW